MEPLQDISSSRFTFICMDALDECQARHCAKLLDSLNEILQNSPGAQIFLTRGPDIWHEVDKHLAGSAATRSITQAKNDIVIFLRAKLNEDKIPDATNKIVEEEFIKNIPETVWEM